MIVRTLDHQRLVSECASDLDAWHPDWSDIDWPRTLAQPGFVLLTDGAGSWCLVEPAGDDRHLEGHVIIAPAMRGKAGIEIGRDMLAWIDLHLSPRILTAHPRDRRARIYLLLLGFTAVADTDTFEWRG